MAALNTLPNEILSLITTHLERPRDLLYLSLASRRLNEFTKLDGWKALLKGRFGLGGLDSDAYNAVHGLTTLCRNWDRRGLIARYLEPTEKTMSMNTWQAERWRGPQGQTMGYQPSIDSYEEMYGSWGERREVLAWSAGTQIVLRTKETGANIEKIRKREEGLNQASDQTWGYDAFKHLNTWFTYKIPDSFEGRDDITKLKLLRPHQRDLAYEDVVFGTASGQLSLLSVSPDLAETQTQHYDTNRRGINGLSVSWSNAPMLATALADSSLALYSINRDSFSNEAIKPSSEVKTISDGALLGRLWSCEFLSSDTVAVGWGPHIEPIEVYHIGPEGLSSSPLRRFNVAIENQAHSRPTSIYPILPVPSTAQGASEAGHTFLSGGYDGIIRLHDMRSPRGFEQIFWDPTNDSPIYSLAAQGLERIVAGVALHSMIKVFDVRFSGSHSYHTISIPGKPANNPKTKSSPRDSSTNAIVGESMKSHVPTKSGGWNLYLNPRSPPPPTAYRQDYSRVREDSPVYSLSIPSATSQNLYAGLEGAVQGITFSGIADKWPDPMMARGLVRHHHNNRNVNGELDREVGVRASYNPDGGALNLGMYEQGTEEGIGMQLLVQARVTGSTVRKERRNAAMAKGLDERWIDLRDEGERWTRGEVVPRREGPPRGPRTGGRGRGRGGRGRGRGA
jgi:WD40 repeat protein